MLGASPSHVHRTFESPTVPTMASDALPNIYVIGAPSTGKTTLVSSLQSHFGAGADPELGAPQVISEVARSVLKKHSFTANDIRSNPNRCLALQKLILDAQVAAERSALAEKGWFVSDRSGPALLAACPVLFFFVT